MSNFPTTARCVVIGAGIVGNCLVGHLSDMGWDDIVLIDKGPLPNPGGSTGHASNFIFPVDGSNPNISSKILTTKVIKMNGIKTINHEIIPKPLMHK